MRAWHMPIAIPQQKRVFRALWITYQRGVRQHDMTYSVFIRPEEARPNSTARCWLTWPCSTRLLAAIVKQVKPPL